MTKSFKQFIFSFMIILLSVFNGISYGRDHHHKLILSRIKGKSIIEIKEGKFIRVVVSNNIIKGRWYVLNDSSIVINKIPISIDSIYKLRIGHLGVNIALSSTLVPLSLASFVGAGELIYYAARTDLAILQFLVFGVAATTAGIGVSIFIPGVKSIDYLRWKYKKNFKFSLQLK